MKKLLSLIITSGIVISFICCASLSTSGQKGSFSGTLTYTISYDGDWDAATLSTQPKEITIKIGRNKTKTEILAGGASIVTIVNGNDSSQIMLINAMGLKFFVRSSKAQLLSNLDDMMSEEPVIKYLDETKQIAGLTAKKAEYITKDEYGDDDTTVVYYSEKIGDANLNFAGQFHGLKGYPLEYIVKTEQGTITFTASEINTKKVKDTEFLIPADYEEKSRDELKEMFGG